MKKDTKPALFAGFFNFIKLYRAYKIRAKLSIKCMEQSYQLYCQVTNFIVMLQLQ
jgi:hypothetical protein